MLLDTTEGAVRGIGLSAGAADLSQEPRANQLPSGLSPVEASRHDMGETVSVPHSQDGFVSSLPSESMFRE